MFRSKNLDSNILTKVLSMVSFKNKIRIINVMTLKCNWKTVYTYKSPQEPDEIFFFQSLMMFYLSLHVQNRLDWLKLSVKQIQNVKNNQTMNPTR